MPQRPISTTGSKIEVTLPEKLPLEVCAPPGLAGGRGHRVSSHKDDETIVQSRTKRIESRQFKVITAHQVAYKDPHYRVHTPNIRTGIGLQSDPVSPNYSHIKISVWAPSE